MSQSDIVMLVLTGVIFGACCFFSWFMSKIAEDEHGYRSKEIETLIQILKSYDNMSRYTSVVTDKLTEIKELEVQIYDICDRIEKRVSSLSADTMWVDRSVGGIPIFPTDESEVPGDSGD